MIFYFFFFFFLSAKPGCLKMRDPTTLAFPLVPLGRVAGCDWDPSRLQAAQVHGGGSPRSCFFFLPGLTKWWAERRKKRYVSAGRGALLYWGQSSTLGLCDGHVPKAGYFWTLCEWFAILVSSIVTHGSTHTPVTGEVVGMGGSPLTFALAGGLSVYPWVGTPSRRQRSLY